MHIRPLTIEEQTIFSGSMLKAVMITPAFRDLLALLQPFRDETAKTCYVDKYARLGLGNAFFARWDTEERAVALIHEAMHIGNNHHVRGSNIDSGGENVNIAADFEINSAIVLLKEAKNEDLILPQDEPWYFPRNKSMEAYYKLLVDNGFGKKPEQSQVGTDSQEDTSGSEDEESTQEDSQGDPGDDENSEDGDSTQGDSEDGTEDSEDSSGGSGSSGDSGKESDDGSGWSCEPATEERMQQADEAGIYKMPNESQVIARQNAEARALEEVQQNELRYGMTAGDSFLKVALDAMKPSKTNWKYIFRPIMSRLKNSITRGKSERSFSRPNRRMTNAEFLFPGTFTYRIKSMLAFDTSLSMQQDDYSVVFPELEEIIRQVGELEVFSVDAKATNMHKVKSIKDLTFHGGGGTDMSVAFRYVNDLPKREIPDIFILATDGGFNWNAIIKELEEATYMSVILITDQNGMHGIPSRVEQFATVIDISPVH